MSGCRAKSFSSRSTNIIMSSPYTMRARHILDVKGVVAQLMHPIGASVIVCYMVFLALGDNIHKRFMVNKASEMPFQENPPEEGERGNESQDFFFCSRILLLGLRKHAIESENMFVVMYKGTRDGRA